MALPKKRKKLEVNEINKIDENVIAQETEIKDRPSGTKDLGKAEKAEGDAQMIKAFEIIEQIDGPTVESHKSITYPIQEGVPKKIRIRITLDRIELRGADSPRLKIPVTDQPLGVDFRVPIPSFVWRVPIFRDFVQILLCKLYLVE